MDGEPDSHTAAMMHADPARAPDGVQHCIQDRPIGDGVAPVLHFFCLAVRRSDATAIQMVAADDDWSFYLSLGDKVVEDFSILARSP